MHNIYLIVQQLLHWMYNLPSFIEEQLSHFLDASHDLTPSTSLHTYVTELCNNQKFFSLLKITFKSSTIWSAIAFTVSSNDSNAILEIIQVHYESTYLYLYEYSCNYLHWKCAHSLTSELLWVFFDLADL